MATIKKGLKRAQEGDNVKPTFFKSNKDKMSMEQLDKSFDDKKYRPSKISANKTKYLSEDKNYVMKEKYEDKNNPDKRTSTVQRRTLRGFLSGAPRATGKANLDDKGNLVSYKKGGAIKKKMKNGGMHKAQTGTTLEQKQFNSPSAVKMRKTISKQKAALKKELGLILV